MSTFLTILRPTPFGFVEEKLNSPGVYIVGFRKAGYFYFGSTNKCSHRINQHISDLKKNKHKNEFFQRVYAKHANEICWYFKYTTDRQGALIDEQKYITEHYNNVLCMNLSTNATVPKHSERGREILRAKAIKQHADGTFNSEKVAAYHRSAEGRLMHSIAAKKQRMNPEYTKRLTSILRDKLKKYHDVTVIDPSGQELVIGWNLREFCRKHKLDRGNFAKVLKGAQKTHKGWRLKWQRS